jgi:hypothetical protein
MNVAVFNLVTIYTELVETMSANEMHRRKDQLFVTRIASLLIEVLGLLLHQTNIFPHLIDTLAHLFNAILLNLTLFVHLTFLLRLDYPLLVLQLLYQKWTQNIKLKVFLDC